MSVYSKYIAPDIYLEQILEEVFIFKAHEETST